MFEDEPYPVGELSVGFGSAALLRSVYGAVEDPSL